MKFSRLWFESQLSNHVILERFKKRFPYLPQKSLPENTRAEDVFQTIKRPYLLKRNDLQIFIGEKQGTKVKEAPPAYGAQPGPHYYFVHAYNCVYECEYCYLQGHFQSPDIVLFINYHDILQEMKVITDRHISQGIKDNESVWFHAGEFSDGLALNHLTQEHQLISQFCQENPRASVEYRSKATRLNHILQDLKPLQNLVFTFSLSSQEAAKTFDHHTPPIKHRLLAMAQLAEKGHPLGIHLDPIVWRVDLISEYREFFTDLAEIIMRAYSGQLSYVSLGVVRFPQAMNHSIEKHYPNSQLWNGPLKSAPDGKKRYPMAMRRWILSQIEDLAIQIGGIPQEKIYWCMEDIPSES